MYHLFPNSGLSRIIPYGGVFSKSGGVFNKIGGVNKDYLYLSRFRVQKVLFREFYQCNLI